MDLRPRWIAVLCVVLGCLSPGWAESQSEPAASPKMTIRQFVLLFRGPNQKPMGEREIQRHQEAHLDYLDELLAQGRIVIEGPLDGGGDLRSIVVLDAATIQEAERIMADDPWVRIGRLRAEAHPWSIPEGVLREPTGHVYNTRCYLVLLQRPAESAEYSAEQLQEIRVGHRTNIERMTKSGELLLAGAIADDGSLREVYIFRTGAPERIAEWVGDDPAIKLGQLQADILPWHVLDGTLPAR